MKYRIINVELLTLDTIRLSLETDSDWGVTECKLTIPREQYEKHKLNVGSYFEINIQKLGI